MVGSRRGRRIPPGTSKQAHGREHHALTSSPGCQLREFAGSENRAPRRARAPPAKGRRESAWPAHAFDRTARARPALSVKVGPRDPAAGSTEAEPVPAFSTASPPARSARRGAPRAATGRLARAVGRVERHSKSSLRVAPAPSTKQQVDSDTVGERRARAPRASVDSGRPGRIVGDGAATVRGRGPRGPRRLRRGQLDPGRVVLGAVRRRRPRTGAGGQSRSCSRADRTRRPLPSRSAAGQSGRAGPGYRRDRGPASRRHGDPRKPVRSGTRGRVRGAATDRDPLPRRDPPRRDRANYT